jgi:Mrp family chromosome partitioning ATPase
MRLRSVEEPAGLTSPAKTAHSDAGDGAHARLGEILIDMGMVEREDLDRIAQRQAETGDLFGACAVAMGLIDDVTLNRAIKRQQRFHVLDMSDGRIDPLVVTAFEPTDPLSLGARRLRSTVSATLRPDNEPVRLVAVTGVDAPTEAALIAANLAVAFAQAGYRTLLVDSNIDTPGQHDLFRIPNRGGVVSMLTQSGPVEPLLQPTAIEGLWVLPTGPVVPNSAELLDRGRLYERLRGPAEAFDMVIVDASQADISTAVALSQGMDGVLIALRRNNSPLAGLHALVDGLEARHTPVIGTIVAT